MGVFQRKPDREEGTAANGETEAEAGRGLLDSLKKRGGGLMDRVAGSVKEAARSSLLKQAIEARERGNLAAAFHLAKEAHDDQADEPEVASFYWDVAVAYERPSEAVAAVASLIRKNAIGAHELATQYWIELDGLVPGSVIDPSTLVRLIPHLAEQVKADAEAEAEERSGPEGPEGPEGREGREGGDAEADPEMVLAREARAARTSALRSAVRGIVDERNRESLTAGVAMHVAELAKELDPECAVAAARHALGCDDIHETKRDRMRALISELDPGATPQESECDPAPPSEGAPPAAAAEPVEPAEPDEPDEPDEPESAAAPSDCGSDESDSESSVTEIHARNHPMRTESPPHAGLSDREVQAMQKRLPPSRPGSVERGGADAVEDESEQQPAVEAAHVQGSEVPLEAAPSPLGEPESVADDRAVELEPGPDGEFDLDILADSAPDLEVDDLEVSQPDLEVDVDLLAQSFPELNIEELPEAPASEPEPEVAAAGPDLDVEIGEPDHSAASAVSQSPPAVVHGADVSETDEALAALDPQPEPLGEPEDVAVAVATPETRVAAEIPIDPSVEAPLFPDLKRMPARPTALQTDALLIEVAGQRRARIEFALVQAIAVGEVSGLAAEPVVIIDLLMDAGDNGGAPRRLVRLRSDEFDPLELVPAETDAGEALRSLLTTLMERTHAIPLPDPEAALGLIVPSFDSLDAYEQQVLQVQR
ncbi:MAG: hypothetical protein JRE70_07495 [Deltaproteobacteria bacterium]|nr:hypothetical protein [Deltaproteobacteria bacterium]